MKKIYFLMLFISTITYSQQEKFINKEWIVDFYIENGVKTFPNNNLNKIYFKSNNTFILIEDGENVIGTWTYIKKKNIIKLKINGFSIEVPFKIKILNEKIFAWEAKNDETGFTKITYMKINQTQ